MLKRYILLLLGLFVASASIAAVDSTEVKSATLTLAAIYGNNANYYGQAAEVKLPYALTNASYRLKNGIYFSAGSYKLINYEGPAISELDLSAGFETNLSKKLNASFGYTRSFYAQNSPLLQAANENTISAGLEYDFNIFKAALNNYYSFGTQQDNFSSLELSKVLNLGSLFNDKDFISFEPGFELVGGTINYLEEYRVERGRRNPSAQFPPRPPYKDRIRYSTGFGMLSYNTNLLLGYNRSNYLLEAGWTISALGKNISDNAKKARSFFNLSFYYQF